ncbi:MAG TPA: hypothetical protein VIY69_11660 [Candidatus Acidoferrales bacterium]
MTNEVDRQTIIDDEHLKLLALGYMISAAVSAFFSLIGLMYMGMGAFLGEMISHIPATAPNPNQPPPAFFGWLFGGIGLLIFLLMLGIAAVKLRAAFLLKQRRGRTFCMVIAGLCCLGVPYGTLLGVFTFIVLGRASVERVFRGPQATTS